MALYAFDGTGNEDEDFDTNTLEFFRAFQDPRRTTIRQKSLGSLYLKGIGTRAQTRSGDLLAQKWGLGGHRRVREALDRLENNQEAGDTEIHIVGFSRGAALALSFANEIAHKYPGPAASASLVSSMSSGSSVFPDAKSMPATTFAGHPPPAAFATRWHWTRARLFFPLTRVSRDGVADPQVVEVWFRGVHSDVGGGNNNRSVELGRSSLDVSRGDPSRTSDRSRLP